ncbi:ABC transporter ATP-binding protein [Rubellimicrobium aerolatum]|uniref:ABC transporter ATP-binding protein n=1 Tax=Rubellimicrobium aerolatum TaxID=490979 RepID=A0ABW0SGM6_9RHOB|nr:ABC transporter ATP-binding protein [Rubellimicrobium aerolatum]MBP1807506.1 ABC-type Fe3+/spermidine/putrescine transport system ATPase subunit [Rubellimicrobium aerolatum]
MSAEPMLEAMDVVHRYGLVTALANVSLTAGRGEFLTILGSSGSGKTTLLRVISGLEMPKSVRRLRIGGVDVAGLPPSKRSCTTVFQSYALFPHMSVIENVMYGLRIRNVNREEATRAARQALAMVQLEHKGDRRIAQLSGGERQRVALARAVVTRPSILLLDEPLGALDERLRQDMQLELVQLQRSLGMTFVYITHSQEEALTMSDRVVLMSHGRIVQSGAPLDLFDRPGSRFAAEFMGYENILPGTLRGQDRGYAVVDLPGGVQVRGVAMDAASQPGAAVAVAVRAERLSPGANGPAVSNVLPATLTNKLYRGKYTDLTVATAAGSMRLRRWENTPLGETISSVTWKAEDCVVLAASDKS